jgi:hypothetical protein
MNQAPGVKARWTTAYEPNVGDPPLIFNTTGQLEGGYNPEQGFNASMMGWPHLWGSNVSASRWRNTGNYYPGALRAGLGPQLGMSYRSRPMTSSGSNDIVEVGQQYGSTKGALHYGARGFLEYTPTDWLKLRLDAQGMFDPQTNKLAEGTAPTSGEQTNEVNWKFSPGVQLSATIPITSFIEKKKMEESRRRRAELQSKKNRFRPMWEEGGMTMDLTDDEIEQYKQGGYIVEELPQAQFGRGRGKIRTRKVKSDKSEQTSESSAKTSEQPVPQFGMQEVMSSNCPEDYVWDSQTQACIPFQNVVEATVYGNPERAKEQKNLFNKLAEAKRAFKNTFIEEGYGGKQLDIKDKGSIEGLKHNIQLYKKNLELEKQRTEKARRALALLKKHDSETWGNKKVKDVLNGPEAIEALREMYAKGDLTRENFMNYYNNFGQATDQNVIEGGRGQAYSAKEAQEEWGDHDHWNSFMDLVQNAAMFIPSIPGLALTAPYTIGSATGLMSGLGKAFNYAPFATAPWLSANSVLTPYFAYEALKEDGDLHNAYKDFEKGNYLGAAENAAFGAFGLYPYLRSSRGGLEGLNFLRGPKVASKTSTELIKPLNLGLSTANKQLGTEIFKPAADKSILGRFFGKPKATTPAVAETTTPVQEVVNPFVQPVKPESVVKAEPLKYSDAPTTENLQSASWEKRTDDVIRAEQKQAHDEALDWSKQWVYDDKKFEAYKKNAENYKQEINTLETEMRSFNNAKEDAFYDWLGKNHPEISFSDWNSVKPYHIEFMSGKASNVSKDAQAILDKQAKLEKEIKEINNKQLKELEGVYDPVWLDKVKEIIGQDVKLNAWTLEDALTRMANNESRVVYPYKGDPSLEGLPQNIVDDILSDSRDFSGKNYGLQNKSITLGSEPWRFVKDGEEMYRFQSYEDPLAIQNTSIHENVHTSQKPFAWMDELTKYSPELEYRTNRNDTPISKMISDAMVVGDKKDPDSIWTGTVSELHAELGPARKKVYDDLVKEGTDPNTAMQMLKQPNDEIIDLLIKEGRLNRFFKSATTEEAKREIIKILPMIIAAAGVASAAAASSKSKQLETEKRKRGGQINKRSTFKTDTSKLQKFTR